ncbi:hypothetical protein BDZ97DRAFT_1782016 [Flammula alnicola]|nr:hypothetical protein BDZ97DRAFT_1782016 [Flammula alnicola]
MDQASNRIIYVFVLAKLRFSLLLFHHHPSFSRQVPIPFHHPSNSLIQSTCTAFVPSLNPSPSHIPSTGRSFSTHLPIPSHPNNTAPFLLHS